MKLDAEFFRRRLFLNNTSEVEQYLGSHGVFPSDDGLYSIREVKQNFCDPEDALPIWVSEEIKNKAQRKTPGDIMWGERKILRPWVERKYIPSSAFSQRSTQLVETTEDILDQVEAQLSQKDETDFETEILYAKSEELADEVVDENLQEISAGVLIQERRDRIELEKSADELVQKVVNGELRRLFMNALLAIRIEREEEEQKAAENAAKLLEMTETWREEIAFSSLEKILSDSQSDILYGIITSAVNDKINDRNKKVVAAMSSSLSFTLISSEIVALVATLAQESLTELANEQAERISEMRGRRQARIAKQAAIWWRKQTRIAIRRKRARSEMPKLAKENLLAKIGKAAQKYSIIGNSGQFQNILSETQNNLNKSWKEKKRRSTPKKSASASFDYHNFILESEFGYSPNHLIGSIFIQSPHDMLKYAEEKFGIRKLVKTSGGVLFINVGTILPEEEFDCHVAIAPDEMSVPYLIQCDPNNTVETDKNIKESFRILLGNLTRKYTTKYSLLKILEMSFPTALQEMGGLIPAYTKSSVAQNPELIADFLNDFTDQVADRLADQGTDRFYPKEITDENLIPGPTITEEQIQVIRSFKLDVPKFNLTQSPENIYKQLETYLKSFQSTPLYIQIKRVFFRAMNDVRKELKNNLTVFQ